MFEFVHHRLPCTFDNSWISNSVRTRRVLWNNHQFNIPFVRLESYKKFPYSDLPRLWNEVIIPNTNPNHQNDDNNGAIYALSSIMLKKQFCLKLKDFLLPYPTKLQWEGLNVLLSQKSIYPDSSRDMSVRPVGWPECF